jgi:predicted phage baseplate assembly protein
MALLEPERESDPWLPARDLLGSDRFAREFVLEIDSDGHSNLRFGNDVLGAQPEAGFAAQAYYRVGNGRVGNVGHDTIVNIVTKIKGITKVNNPLPAVGGIDPEDLESVRLYAPQAFRRQERAVTAEDYAEVTQRHPGVQRAAATIRWTGSWYTVFVTIDRIGGLPVDAAFENEIREFLERYRMAGQDLEVNAPVAVPLEIKLEVCVKAGYYKSNVKSALTEVFSNRVLARQKGFFHPDHFTFGTPVYLSQIYATAMQVAGVQSLEVQSFKRLGKTANNEFQDAELRVGRLEIVRLDNDPNFPENGKLELLMKGGL